MINLWSGDVNVQITLVYTFTKTLPKCLCWSSKCPMIDFMLIFQIYGINAVFEIVRKTETFVATLHMAQEASYVICYCTCDYPRCRNLLFKSQWEVVTYHIWLWHILLGGDKYAFDHEGDVPWLHDLLSE